MTGDLHGRNAQGTGFAASVRFAPLQIDRFEIAASISGRFGFAVRCWIVINHGTVYAFADDLPIHDNNSAKRLGTGSVQRLHRDSDRPRR